MSSINREDYIVPSVLARVTELQERGKTSDNKVTFSKDDRDFSLAQAGFDVDEVDRAEEFMGEYLAAAVTVGTERIQKHFNENEDCSEGYIDVTLGKHQKARSVVSRSYTDENDDEIKNHVLTEHKITNNHFEGVQRLLTAIANRPKE